MNRYLILFFAMPSLFAIIFDSKDFLPEYQAIFLEEYNNDHHAMSHTEDVSSYYSKIVGNLAGQNHKLHVMLGPDYGLVMRISKASSFFNSSGGASYKMPGFNWDTKYDDKTIDLKHEDANVRLHSRKTYLFKGLKIIPYGGFDYVALKESKIGDNHIDRDTTLFYAPIGVAVEKNDVVLHLALSGMLWGDVRVNDVSPDVDNGYGLVFGILWHKSENTSCHLDWDMKSYNVNQDVFALGSRVKGDVANKLSEWNVNCNLVL